MKSCRGILQICSLCLLGIFLSSASGSASSCISNKIHSIMTGDPKIVFSDERVSILYFPDQVHSKLSVGDDIYNPTFGYSLEKSSVDTFLRKARMKGLGVIRAELRMSVDEIKKMRNFINAHPNALQGCTGGACRAVTRNSDIVIPFPLSQYPTLNIAYLALAKTLGYKRIISVSYIGRRPLLASAVIPVNAIVEQGLGFFAWVPIIAGGSAVYLLFNYLTEDNKNKQAIVESRLETRP